MRAVRYTDAKVASGAGPDPAQLAGILSKPVATTAMLEVDQDAVRVVLQELQNMLRLYRHTIAHDVNLMY